MYKRPWFKPEDEPFAWNKAAQAVYERLNKYKYAIIKGGPGEGKTGTARAVMKKYGEEHQGCELNELDRIDDFSTEVDSSRETLIIIDDVLGKDETDPKKQREIFDRYHRYWEVLDACVHCGETRAIMTVRRKTLNDNWSCLLRYKMFKEEVIVELETGDYKLTHVDKRNILEKHCTHNNISICMEEKDVNYESDEILKTKGFIPVRISTSMFHQIVDTEPLIGYPQAVKLFTSDRKNTQLGVNFFKYPQKSTIEEIQSYRSGDHRMDAWFGVLLYMMFNNGEIKKEHVDEEIMERVKKEAECTSKLNRFAVSDALSELKNKYVVKNENEVYTFKHDNVKEAVAIVFAEDYPERALKEMDFDTIMKFCRTINYKGKANEIMLKIRPKEFIHLAKRFLEEHPLWLCVSHPAMDDDAFLDVYIDQVMQDGDLISRMNDSCFSRRGIFTKACIAAKLPLLNKLWQCFSPKMSPMIHEALACSAANDKEEIVRWLLGRRTELVDHQLLAPINEACRFGSMRCLQCIMDYKEQLGIENVTKGLYNACFAGHRDIIAYLLSSRPDFTLQHKREAMSWAIVGGQIEAMDQVFARSSELANHQYMSFTMFGIVIPFVHIAAFFGRMAVYERLTTSGMLCDEHNSKFTVLQSAMFGFKNAGVDYESVSLYTLARTDLFGHYCTGLYDAGKRFPPVSEYCRIIQHIIDHPSLEDTSGIDLKLDQHGNTVAHYCVLNNAVELLGSFARKYPDMVMTPNSKEILPIHLALFLGRSNLVGVLLPLFKEKKPKDIPLLKDIAVQGTAYAECSFDGESEKPELLDCLEPNQPKVKFAALEEYKLLQKML